MRSRSPLLTVAVLLLLGTAGQSQTYTIKVKLDADPGQSIVYRETSKQTGTSKLFDPEGNLLDEDKPTTTEVVYTHTTLEKGDLRPAKFKRVYEKATEAKGDEKARAKSHQGRTLLFELHEGKYRAGVVGKPALEATDLDDRVKNANDSSPDRAILQTLAPRNPVKVGDSWKLDIKPLTASMPPAKFDLNKSTVEVKLVKVYTRDKSQFGVFDIQMKLSMTSLGDPLPFDPPAVIDATGTLDVAIDGSSTQSVLTLKTKIAGKAKLLQGKEVKGSAVLDIVQESRDERSAEKPDPKGREIPVVDFGAQKPTWKAFKTKAGKFSADFPGTPKEEAKKDGNGNTTTTTSVQLEKGELAYMVTWTTYANDISKTDPSLILESVAKSFEKNTKSKKEISINGFPGLEIVHSAGEGDATVLMSHRIYVVNERVYQLLAIVRANKKEILESDKFFKSFKLDEKKEQ